jgi:hypothetical protein
MNSVEDKRFMRRKAVFMAEGLSEDDALDLAYSLMLRDRDVLDDRRLCFECQHLVKKNCERIRDRLGKPTQQLRFILQRCEYFKLKESK